MNVRFTNFSVPNYLNNKKRQTVGFGNAAVAVASEAQTAQKLTSDYVSKIVGSWIEKCIDGKSPKEAWNLTADFWNVFFRMDFPKIKKDDFLLYQEPSGGNTLLGICIEKKLPEAANYFLAISDLTKTETRIAFLSLKPFGKDLVEMANANNLPHLAQNIALHKERALAAAKFQKLNVS